ncbi:MAG: hypothetical protein ACYCZL_11070, partial [Polaromonas sp.]
PVSVAARAAKLPSTKSPWCRSFPTYSKKPGDFFTPAKRTAARTFCRKFQLFDDLRQLNQFAAKTGIFGELCHAMDAGHFTHGG